MKKLASCALALAMLWTCGCSERKDNGKLRTYTVKIVDSNNVATEWKGATWFIHFGNGQIEFVDKDGKKVKLGGSSSYLVTEE